MGQKVKVFEIVWQNDDCEEVEGDNIKDALVRAGYGSGSISAVKEYKEISQVNLNISEEDNE